MESGKRLEPYKIIAYGGMGELEEKKSRFIAPVASAGTEEEALAFIEARKKQYWDARHNCYAYVLGEQAQTVRFSDDGEPAGTAGRPIGFLTLVNRIIWQKPHNCGFFYVKFIKF